MLPTVLGRKFDVYEYDEQFRLVDYSIVSSEKVQQDSNVQQASSTICLLKRVIVIDVGSHMAFLPRKEFKTT
jgi:hypothetical protein